MTVSFLLHGQLLCEKYLGILVCSQITYKRQSTSVNVIFQVQWLMILNHNLEWIYAGDIQ